MVLGFVGLIHLFEVRSSIFMFDSDLNHNSSSTRIPVNFMWTDLLVHFFAHNPNCVKLRSGFFFHSNSTESFVSKIRILNLTQFCRTNLEFEGIKSFYFEKFGAIIDVISPLIISIRWHFDDCRAELFPSFMYLLILFTVRLIRFVTNGDWEEKMAADSDSAMLSKNKFLKREENKLGYALNLS